MDMNDLFGDYQNGNYSAPQTSTPMQENNFNSYANGNVKGNKKTKAPKAKKGGFGFILVLLLIIAIAGGGFYVYAYTDVFRTPKELMAKYLMNMIEVVEKTTPISKQIAEKTTGTSIVDGSLKIPAAVALGINSIDVDMQADYDKDMAEFKIGTKLAGQDMDISIIANKDEVAVGSSLIDLSADYDKKYVGVKNENLKNFAKIFELDAEIVKYIPDTINFDGLENLFTEEEKADIQKRYLEILNTKLTDEMFSVENNAETKVNGTAYQTKKVSLNVSTTTLVEIAYDVITELRDDRLILDSYKKVIDVELPKDKLDQALDEILTELEDAKATEAESPSGSMVVNVYIYKGNALKFEAIMFDEELKVLQESNYAVIETDKGFKCISETFSPEGTYSPSQTQSTVLDIENSATSQKITATVKMEYGEVPQAEDSFYSFNTYENETAGYVYEIKNYSTKGYSDSITYEVNGEKMIEFTSDVKFDESVTVTEIDDKNTLFINDLSRQEFNELIGVIALAITGEELPEDDSDDLFQSTDVTDDPFADMDTDYDDLFTNTIEDEYVTDDTVENTVIPDLVVRDDTENNAAEDAKDTLLNELTQAIDICKTEAEKTEYGVIDYLNIENLNSLCPSIETVEQVDLGVNTAIQFNITDTAGYNYLYRIFLDDVNPDVVNGDTLSQL